MNADTRQVASWPATASAGTAVTSNKKGATVGSGGQRRRGLEGKGPTPPAEARKGHAKKRVANAKAKRAAAAAAPAARRPRRQGRLGDWSSAATRSSRRCATDVPATALYVQQYIDNDDRVREALQLATERGASR